MDRKHLAKEIRSAIQQGDAKRAMALLGADKSVLEMITPFGTWLHVAATHGQLEIVKGLIELGADMDRRAGTFGSTPLNHAASEGHIEIVKYLLSRGARMDVSEPERNPLFAAIHNGHTAIAKLLIDSGIDTRVKYSGASMVEMDALAFAREWGRTEVVEMLTTSAR